VLADVASPVAARRSLDRSTRWPPRWGMLSGRTIGRPTRFAGRIRVNRYRRERSPIQNNPIGSSAKAWRTAA
jgi:hypothetical protein